MLTLYCVNSLCKKKKKNIIVLSLLSVLCTSIKLWNVKLILNPSKVEAFPPLESRFQGKVCVFFWGRPTFCLLSHFLLFFLLSLFPFQTSFTNFHLSSIHSFLQPGAASSSSHSCWNSLVFYFPSTFSLPPFLWSNPPKHTQYPLVVTRWKPTSLVSQEKKGKKKRYEPLKTPAPNLLFPFSLPLWLDCFFFSLSPLSHH